MDYDKALRKVKRDHPYMFGHKHYMDISSTVDLMVRDVMDKHNNPSSYMRVLHYALGNISDKCYGGVMDCILSHDDYDYNDDYCGSHAVDSGSCDVYYDDDYNGYIIGSGDDYKVIRTGANSFKLCIDGASKNFNI